MKNGYVKFWRAALENELLISDNTCWIVYTKLLLLVDKNTGAYRTGRNRLATLCNLKPSTLRDALKRLNSATIIRLETDSRTTTIYLCNFDFDDRTTTERRQQTDTKQEERSITTNVVKSSSNELNAAHTWICSLFGKNPNRYKLSEARKRKLKLRLKEFSKQDFARAYQNIARSKFHRGDNDRGWTIDADPYWLVHSHERMSNWANRESASAVQAKTYRIPGSTPDDEPVQSVGLSADERERMEQLAKMPHAERLKAIYSEG